MLCMFLRDKGIDTDGVRLPDDCLFRDCVALLMSPIYRGMNDNGHMCDKSRMHAENCKAVTLMFSNGSSGAFSRVRLVADFYSRNRWPKLRVGYEQCGSSSKRSVNYVHL